MGPASQSYHYFMVFSTPSITFFAVNVPLFNKAGHGADADMVRHDLCFDPRPHGP